MPVALSADQLSAVVTRLRAAGCVYAEEEAALLVEAADNLVRLEEMVQGRCTGLPVEQVVGWAQFCGLRIQLEPGVFVPRRRTEFLVRVAVALLPRTAVVVDLCCGSGAAGAAVRAAGLAGGGEVELHAADVDPAAVRCARRNVRGAVHEGDLYAPLPAALRGHVDVLLANAPYVPSDEVPLMPAEARLHEHPVALDGGPDGLDVQRRVAADAGSWLAPGGHLLIETSRRQAAGTLALVRRGGLLARTERCDDLDATVVVGTRCGLRAAAGPGRRTAGLPASGAGSAAPGRGDRHAASLAVAGATSRPVEWPRERAHDRYRSHRLQPPSDDPNG